MGTDRNAAAERPSEHAVVVPVKQLMDEELERRIELVRTRDNVGRGEAFKAASEWLQSQIKTDLLADVERGLYRIWYSRSKHSGNFHEVAIWFEGALYEWPSARDWLCKLLQETFDDQCQSIGTFFRSNERGEREALESELEAISASVEMNVHGHDHIETVRQGDLPTTTDHGQSIEQRLE